MASCCTCSGSDTSGPSDKSTLPLICLVPKDVSQAQNSTRSHPASDGGSSGLPQDDLHIFDDEYLRKHFNFPQRSLYLDAFRRPLISFPMTQEDVKHFNMARKAKINQQILDGFLDPSSAITAPSVFPYAKSDAEKKKDTEEDEEIIYILQLPDWEFQCPVHGQTVRTPRFIWHSCKKTTTKAKPGEQKQGGGPLHKPKPWLLSRLTDFDFSSQW